MPVSVATVARNAMMDALSTQIGTGAKLRFYSGTRPANVGTALAGNTLLAELVGNADQGHRRVATAEVAPPDVTELLRGRPILVHHGRVDRERDQVVGLAAGRGERGQEIRRGGVELLDHAVTAAHLAAQPDHSPARRDHRVRKPDRLAKLRRIDDQVVAHRPLRNSRIGRCYEKVRAS